MFEMGVPMPEKSCVSEEFVMARGDNILPETLGLSTLLATSDCIYVEIAD